MEDLLKITTTFGEFKSFLGRLSHAVSSEETRYYLNGICFEKKDGELNAIATDGHQMACIDMTRFFSGKFEGKDFSKIIPARAVYRIVTSKTKSKENPYSPYKSEHFVFRITEKHCYFEFDGAKEEYPLINGSFPEWRRVMPTATEKIIGFNTSYIKNLCKAIGTESVIFESGQAGTDGAKSSPALVSDDRGGRFVVMPVRI